MALYAFPDSSAYVYPASGGGGGGGGGAKVEQRTISVGEAAAKSLTLAQAPSNAAQVSLNVVGGCVQFYGTDFTVSGTTLTWNGLGLDGLLTSSDSIVLIYPIN